MIRHDALIFLFLLRSQSIPLVGMTVIGAIAEPVGAELFLDCSLHHKGVQVR